MATGAWAAPRPPSPRAPAARRLDRTAGHRAHPSRPGVVSSIGRRSAVPMLDLARDAGARLDRRIRSGGPAGILARHGVHLDIPPSGPARRGRPGAALRRRRSRRARPGDPRHGQPRLAPLPALSDEARRRRRAVLDDLDALAATRDGWDLATASHNGRRRRPEPAKTPPPRRRSSVVLYYAAEPDFQVIGRATARLSHSTTRYRQIAVAAAGRSRGTRLRVPGRGRTPARPALPRAARALRAGGRPRCPCLWARSLLPPNIPYIPTAGRTTAAGSSSRSASSASSPSTDGFPHHVDPRAPARGGWASAPRLRRHATDRLLGPEPRPDPIEVASGRRRGRRRPRLADPAPTIGRRLDTEFYVRYRLRANRRDVSAAEAGRPGRRARGDGRPLDRDARRDGIPRHQPQGRHPPERRAARRPGRDDGRPRPPDHPDRDATRRGDDRPSRAGGASSAETDGSVIASGRSAAAESRGWFRIPRMG